MTRDNLPIAKASYLILALKAFTALAEMINGTATKSEWHQLSDAINVTEALVAAGKLAADPIMGHLNEAVLGMVVAMRCPEGLMRMSAANTLSLRHVVTAYDQALVRLSRRSIEEARLAVVMKIAEQRVRPSNGVVVVE